jgi:predicted dehydrogenase
MRPPLRLGLLAAARITGPAVIEPAALVEGVELVAVAARSPERAREVAETWGVPMALASYDELVTSPDVDAVYVATPASLHHRWTLAALEAGKHVLCEKPLAANAGEAREMVAAAERADRLLMEAFHWRYHPLVGQMAEVLASGRIGAIERVEASFDLPDGQIPRTDIRWDVAIGGGALMDLGCYPLQWVRWAVGGVRHRFAVSDTVGEPMVVAAVAECPVPDIDGRLSAELRWPSGVTGSISCSMISPDPPRIRLDVFGTDGRMLVTNPLAPQFGSRLVVETDAGGRTVETEIEVDRSTTYEHQLAAFRDAVATGVAPPTSGADSVATMELIDACYRAAGLSPRPSLPTLTS